MRLGELMSQRQFAMAVGLAMGFGLISGCSRPWGGYASGARPAPIYTSVPVGTVPMTPTPSSPIATDPNGGGSAGNNGPDGSGLSLQPTMRTSSLFPAYPNSYPKTFAVQPVSTGPQYASVGQTLDGRPISWGGAPMFRSANRPIKAAMSPGSRADIKLRQRAGQISGISMASRVDGIAATPQEDLKYRGGKTMKDVTFVNIYVGGKQAWNENDRKYIDWALASAMADSNLNHVLMQYFNDEPVSSTFKGSYYLEGYRPQRVTQANVKDMARVLYQQGAFKGLPLESTFVNFMLPTGAVLADPDSAQQSSPVSNKIIPHEEESSSLEGLGGYHGSVHVGNDTVYYAVGVYSERRNGVTNGIPAFDYPWKNVVATFYHELQEGRTDPDVDDAITSGQERYIGWTSDSGEEIGDFPVDEDGHDGKLDQVFVEINLAKGSGRVPVQLMYSNDVHGTEGPISKPYKGNPLPMSPPIPVPGSSTPSPPPSQPNSPPPQTPPGHDAELDMINSAWDHLPDSVRMQILKLIKNSDAASSVFQ